MSDAKKSISIESPTDLITKAKLRKILSSVSLDEFVKKIFTEGFKTSSDC